MPYADPNKVLKRAQQLHRTMVDARHSYLDHWDDLRRFLMPRHGKNLTGNEHGLNTYDKGEKKHEDIYRGNHLRFVKNMAAGMHSGLTSPSRPWFKIGFADDELDDNQEVKEWLYETERRMYAVLADSNMYNVLHHCYAELGVFGTAAAAVEEDFKTAVRGRAFTIGEYCISTDASGRVCTFLRSAAFTARQMVDRFGIDKVSMQVKRAFEKGNEVSEFNCWQLVEKRSEHNDLKEAQGREYVSLWYEMGGKNQQKSPTKFLKVSGFEELPFLVPRWEVIADNSYGESAGMDVLPDVQTMQEIAKSIIVATHKEINPAVVVDSSLRNTTVNTMPGGVNWVDGLRGDTGGIRRLYQQQFDIQSSEQLYQNMMGAVAEGLFADLFRMLHYADKNQMTATEVAERQQEKLLLLGPVLERIHSELLDPLIERVFGIMVRLDLVPEPPEIIQGQPLRVQYISILAQAQKLAGITALEQFMGFAGNLAGVDPAVLDVIDLDEGLREYADRLGINPKVLVSEEQVAELRQLRAQRAAQQQAMEQSMMAAQGAKTLSEADTGTNNALTALTQGLGGAA